MATTSLERFGPFFAVEVAVDTGSTTENAATRSTGPSSRWLGLGELTAGDLLTQVVDRTRAVFVPDGPDGVGAADERALASTVALGLFARLLSPSIGGRLTGAPTLRPDPSTTWVRPVDSGPIPLRTTAPLVTADPDLALARLVLPIVGFMSQRYRLSERVLLGNAAAAVVGACDVVALAEPSLHAAAAGLRRRLLTTAPLRDTGSADGAFTRHSCCLIYRLPLDYICANCILVAARTATARRLMAGWSTPAQR